MHKKKMFSSSVKDNSWLTVLKSLNMEERTISLFSIIRDVSTAITRVWFICCPGPEIRVLSVRPNPEEVRD